MELVAVIDIMNGLAVHAKSGIRKQYQPLESAFSLNADPLEISKKLKSELGIASLYIADLDSILSSGDNLRIISKIKKKTGMRLYVDSGINGPDDLDRYINSEIDKLILCTETMLSEDDFTRIISKFGSSRFTVSIDIQNNSLLSNHGLFGHDIHKACDHLMDAAFREFILLDISNVGSMKGTSSICLELMRIYSDKDLSFITGGGIRNIKDVRSVQDAGFEKVLVGSAIYNRSITFNDIKSLVR